LPAQPFAAVVRDVHAAATDVVCVTLAAAEDAELPLWQPGAHIDVHLPSGRIRQYSLHGDPADRFTYRIAVLRIAKGRGGSVELHDLARPGARLRIGMPRNNFRLQPSRHYLFIAGGIGITPLLPMARAVAEDRASWRFVYGGRTRTSMALVGELLPLGPDRIELVPQDECGLPDLAAILGAAPAATTVYCCGPPAMIEAVAAAQNALRPDICLRVERFTAAEPEASKSDAPIDVVLARSQVTVRVAPGVSILDAVREVRPDVMSSCERGICSACETAVLDGVVDHRDSVLTAAERSSNRYMMLCVSRAKTPRLVLDL
jgi:ferredoxin-NADP reductase